MDYDMIAFDDCGETWTEVAGSEFKQVMMGWTFGLNREDMYIEA
jgi:hypothetical protein